MSQQSIVLHRTSSVTSMPQSECRQPFKMQERNATVQSTSLKPGFDFQKLFSDLRAPLSLKM